MAFAMARADLGTFLRIHRTRNLKKPLAKAIRELRDRYDAGLGGGDCETEYDFGYEEGLRMACCSIVEDLDRLLAEFFPEPKARERCQKPAKRSGKATARG